MTRPLLSPLMATLCVALCCADDLPTDAGFTNSLGMRFVRLKAGEFVRGQGDAAPKSRQEWLGRDADESPAHAVVLSRPFYLGVHEVTNAQYERFDPEHKSWRGKHGAGKDDDDPVAFVAWQQAVDFCAWLSKKEGRPYRLPTEAEWEYAARAGTKTLYSTGDALGHDQANLGRSPDGKPRPAVVKVGSYKANPWGLYDTYGNVAEWCHDWHGPYEPGEQTDPVGRADGVARVVRGWSHLATSQPAARFARSANRSGHLPDDANRYTGFRVAMGPMPTTKPLPMAPVALHQKDVKQTPAPKDGPDPKKPYFVDYSKGKRNPTMPADSWGPIFGNHNHYGAACVCPNGDVLAVWYTCVGESDRQLAQAASRLRVGSREWEPASLFFGVPDVNCHAPVLLRDGGRVYHFCTQSLRGWDHASNVMRHSDDSGATWSKPRVILPRTAADHLSQPCTAFVAKGGRIVLACDGDLHMDERLMLSDDRGETWRVAKGCMRAAVGKYAIHPAVAQRKDGAILAFLRGPSPMPVVTSKDYGETWEKGATTFGGLGTGMKPAALRLASGALLLLTMDTSKRFGGGSMVALSLDEGKTWPHARKVDAPVEGYMAADQAADGTIHLIGSRLKFASCNEAWIREGGEWK